MIHTSEVTKRFSTLCAEITLLGVTLFVLGIGLVVVAALLGANSLGLPPQGPPPAPSGQAGGMAGETGNAYASRFAGNDCGAKINAADAWLGSLPGEIWIDRACGTVWTTNLRFSGSRVLRFVQGGTYKVPKIVVPPGPNRLSMIASGVGMTVLQAASPNAPVIQCVQTGGASDGDYFSGFSVQAHPAGSSGPAIDLSGCRGSVFENISYLSNGSANFGSFFRLSASPAYCYSNRIAHPVVVAQTGPPTVFLFDNNGKNAERFNANVTYIENVWICLNKGVRVVFDARRSGLTRIENGDVEGNEAATVLIPGTLTTLSGVWLESNSAQSVVGMSVPDGSSRAVRLTDNYIATPQTFAIGSTSNDWTIVGNAPAANLTVRQ